MAEEVLTQAPKENQVVHQQTAGAVPTALDLTPPPDPALRADGVDELPIASDRLPQLDTANEPETTATANTGAEEEHDTDSTDSDLQRSEAAVPDPSDLAPEVFPEHLEAAVDSEPVPAEAEVNSEATVAVEASRRWGASLISGIQFIGKSLLSTTTKSLDSGQAKPEKTEEKAEDSPSLFERFTDSVVDAWSALTKPDQEKSYWQRFKDSVLGVGEALFSEDRLFAGIGSWISDTWSSAYSTVKSWVTPVKEAVVSAFTGIAERSWTDLWAGDEHPTSATISQTSKAFQYAAGLIDDGVELNTSSELQRIALRDKLFGIAAALEEYARAVEEEEQRVEKIEEEEEFDREQRERLAEMVESLVAGTEDHPELVRYIHDEYREELPVSELIEMMLDFQRKDREQEARHLEAVV